MASLPILLCLRVAETESPLVLRSVPHALSLHCALTLFFNFLRFSFLTPSKPLRSAFLYFTEEQAFLSANHQRDRPARGAPLRYAGCGGLVDLKHGTDFLDEAFKMKAQEMRLSSVCECLGEGGVSNLLYAQRVALRSKEATVERLLEEGSSE